MEIVRERSEIDQFLPLRELTFAQKLDPFQRYKILPRTDLVGNREEIVIPVEEHVVAVFVKGPRFFPLYCSEFPSNKTIPFKHTDFVASLRQTQGGAHPRDTGSYDGDLWLSHLLSKFTVLAHHIRLNPV